ncbi:DMP19 family protein [Rhodoferax saidenbachensis]|uniref:DNA mimic protein DMP19 C-terminal domain-containing protein n=1 Tax=Rhodoferax saidenbachensis TaxID=1484693 RepID=A0A1P8K6Z0_9BURK|nr:DUF4375 domain-containing protein [Rhodoferax saidenbachensis]APW41770.1 hypothetical protein RS694_03880 [Rhodoferax saidenbachensis]
MYLSQPKYPSAQELLAADAKTPLVDSELDDQLWLLLCDRIRSPDDLDGLPSAIGVYYASRLLQWEVGNGGFSQAAYNVPEWLSRAATAYEVLGREQFSALLRKADGLIPSDPEQLEALEPSFVELDGHLDAIEWEIDQARISYVRSQRDAFFQQEVLPLALLGKWKATIQHPSGTPMTSLVQFTHNLQFTSSTTVNETLLMEASGSWKLSGQTLEWRYERSSHPAVPIGLVDTDDIKSVSANELSLISRSSGRQQTYRRI